VNLAFGAFLYFMLAALVLSGVGFVGGWAIAKFDRRKK